jgi:hypothetical protein
MGQPRPAFYERGIAIADAEVTANRHQGELFTHIDENGQPLIMKLVKNVSAAVILPRLTYKYDLDAIGTAVDGVATATARPAGVADSEIPAAGIAINSWFLLAVEGVHDVVSVGAITVGDPLVSAADGKVNTSGATPTFFYMGQAREVAGGADVNIQALLKILN